MILDETNSITLKYKRNTSYNQYYIILHDKIITMNDVEMINKV